jgi:MtN3 and saliva related transmembrane protein
MNNKNKMLETYMSWIVVLGQSMHFIQAWKIYKIKSAEDVSAISYIICITLLIHWLCYGYLIKNRVLIIAEGLGLMGSILVLIGIFTYS